MTRYPILGSDDSTDANNTLFKLDSNGTMLWKKIMWRSSHGVIERIQPDGLGNYYLGNSQDTTWEADDRKNYTATIAKIDDQGNIFWQKYFNDEPKASKGIWDFKTLGNGAVIWQQYYKSFADAKFGVLCDAVELANGDLVITGSAQDSATNKQAIWLLRTDAFGCLQAGCYPLSTIQLEPTQAFALQAFPNPTNGNITLQSNNGSKPQGNVQVYNAQAQIVYNLTQNIASATLKIPLGTQASGLYNVRYTNAVNKDISTLKIVKE